MVTEKLFGEISSGENVNIFHLENKSGAYAEVTAFGAALVKLCVPDRNGDLRDVVLGFDDAEGYLTNDAYIGVTVGPNANRIADSRFSIYGKEYVIANNENENNLHSGPDAFDKKLWDVDVISEEKNLVCFTYEKPDGENGFPGNFPISVTYEFTESNELKITYRGISSEATVANMTNHSYFNLAGEGNGNIFDHQLKIHAKYYTPLRDGKGIPTGEYASVEGTPFDFRKFKKVGLEASSDFEQLRFTNGYDHNFVTDYYKKGNFREVAAVYCEESGIVMEVLTDCPCIQFYAGNFINHVSGKNGHFYDPHAGLALETQFAPNAVNTPEFESPILEKGEIYHSVTSYRFSVK